MFYYLIQNIIHTKIRYDHVEKLALAIVHVVQWFHHYIILRKTTVISDCNPMTYILIRQFLGGKYSKWIAILQEFYLEFTAAKSKKSLVFAESISALPFANTTTNLNEQIPDENLFLISTLTHGIEILLFIFRPKLSDLSCLDSNNTTSDISFNLIELFVIHCTESVFILFFVDS